MGKYISESSMNWKEISSFQKVVTKVLIGDKTTAAFGVSVQEIGSGGKVPIHSHAEESCYYFIEGNGVIHLDDQIFTGGPGSMVYIKSWETHGIDNPNDTPIKYLEVKTPNTMKE